MTHDPRHEGRFALDHIAEGQRSRDTGHRRSHRGRSGGQGGSHRGSHRGHRRRRKRGGLTTLLPALLVLVVLGALVGGGIYGYQWITDNVSLTTEDTDYPGPGSGEALISVEQGDTGTKIAEKLVDQGVIKTKSPFVTVFSNTPEASGIEPGVYRLKKQMNSSDALEMLLDPSSLAGHRVIIPEGVRASVIYQRISKATGIPVKDFEAAAKDYTALGVPKNPAGTLEGYLWPGRYDIPEDAKAKDILEMMTKRMQEELKKRGVDPKDQHRVLTVASLVENEVNRAEDYPKVARVIENRLEGKGTDGGRPMPLQFDSTIHYFTGKDGKVGTSDADRAKNNPYNTYKKPGLPPGPIGNPGAKGIDAALKPADGNWLYFVSVDQKTGETKFAATYEEHQKNVQEWRKNAGKDG